MNNQLAPTYQYVFGYHFLLWYSVSNSYSVIDSNFKVLLDNYFQSNSQDAFFDTLNIEEIETSKLDVIKTIKTYLEGCNIPNIPNKDKVQVLEYSNRKILKRYAYNGKTFQIYFDSEFVKKLIHPPLAHLETRDKTTTDLTFDIYLEGNNLHLFKNETFLNSYPKQDYHKLQGKFMFHLLCSIHDKEENNWIGTLHGSTITNGISSILFVGKSGKGKSTLCTILATKGFNLVADDISPLASTNLNIYSNPAAISTKSGSFSTLRTLVPNFDDLQAVEFNKSKGLIKYIPFKRPPNNHYPCNTIVLVNYKTDSKTDLKKISIVELLETLIPDSWLSPNPKHAKEFLDWLQTLTMYELTYSNIDSMTHKVNSLFNENV
ncbi:hypothetical protein [Winogradskyella sp. UBA3174]|uniref:hypothetical protein n=1 Tax=Winogradskyella sp. UBA3174 TaxID=1947785 RepID=UPI0025DF9D4B|nr:hypothetical protein [Winogradskyella sp. UBA3174]